MPSRFLQPIAPGGLLSPSSGDELTATEELTVQAIAGGTYFVFHETPSGAVNGVNTSFGLANTPAPATSLEVYLNGQRQTLTTDYTLAVATITMIVVPQTNDVLRVNYNRQP